jgi:c-di-GMP-binding flagellar brake protein YcgR
MQILPQTARKYDASTNTKFRDEKKFSDLQYVKINPRIPWINFRSFNFNEKNYLSLEFSNISESALYKFVFEKGFV